MDKVVSVIGAGRIGGEVIRYVRDTPGLRLGRVLTRSGHPDTGDLATFLDTPAALIVDAAGPQALRRTGAACLARSDLWSVGAAALADDALLEDLRAVAHGAGTRLRLFAPWAFGIGTVPADAVLQLSLRIVRPGGPAWTGRLDDAARQFPDEVNFAVAAALNGPGLAATRIELATAAAQDRHMIETDCVTEAGHVRSTLALTRDGRHPTALSLIAALDALTGPIGYG